MGTTTNSRNTKKINCQTCHREYTPMCDYMQGRCPYHPAMFNLSEAKIRFTNLINFFKGK
jgi:hypothetical protein